MPNSIRALVVQLNDWQYLCAGGLGSIGEMQDVPCPAQMEDMEYWAVPQKDADIFTRLDYIALNRSATPPTFDSFQVFRISDKLTGYLWWVRGALSDYSQACEVCCGNAPYPMPTDTPIISPCQRLCLPQNAEGVTQAVFGLPTLAAGETYHPAGALNNVEFPAASEAGYTTVTELLAFLNSTWIDFVWTASSDNITLVATGGIVGDQVCGIVRPILPSGTASI